MRFRLGVVVGFAGGYYLGTKAGRERYEDINRAIAKLKRTDAYETATDKAKEVVDLSVERAKDVIDDKIGGNGASEPQVEKTWPDRLDPVVRP